MQTNISEAPANTLKQISSTLAQPGLQRSLYSLLMILGLIILQRLAIRFINRRLEDPNRRHIYRKIVTYCLTGFGLVALAFIWVHNLAFLTALTGFIAAGLAIALKDVIMALLGWVKIIWTRVLAVGDRIEINETRGDVIDISPLHIVILEIGNWIDANQSTGRIVFIPNGFLFTESLYNFTHGFPYLWDELSLTFTFESDLGQAEELMKTPVDEIGINYKRAREEIRHAGEKYAISYNHLQPRTYLKIEDSGIKISLRYLSRCQGRRETRSRLSTKIMELINENQEVELAYPTYRIYKLGENPYSENQ